MDIEQIRSYCLQKVRVTESFPFDNQTLVFKVMDKMFLLMSLDAMPTTINLKSTSERSQQLREEFPNQIKPGYHMNKNYWNTVVIDGSLPRIMIESLIDDSYLQVVKKLPKYQQLMIQQSS